MNPYISVLMTVTLIVLVYMIIAAAARFAPFKKASLPKMSPSSHICIAAAPCVADPSHKCCPNGTQPGIGPNAGLCCVQTRVCQTKPPAGCPVGFVIIDGQCCK
jgi:hypothetical protein